MLEASYGCNSIVSLQLKTDGICREMRRTVTRDEVFVLCRVVSWKLVLLMCRTKQTGESGLYILVPSDEDAYLVLYNYAIKGKFRHSRHPLDDNSRKWWKDAGKLIW